MRRCILLLLLASTALPALAAKKETVAQLEHMLTAAYAAHKPDAEIARQIGEVALTERLTEATRQRLAAPLAKGSDAALALEVLAEQSAFLDLPVNESVARAAPDAATQQKMLDAARGYGAQVLPGLPNFLATRTIRRFDDRPSELKRGDWAVRAGMHLVDTTSQQISVREERDSMPTKADSAVWQRRIGLISGGEFGNTLGMILADSAAGSIQWSHWESNETGDLAVFNYSVPRTASHFEVLSVVELRKQFEGIGTPRGGATLPGRNVEANHNPSNTVTVRVLPDYHGSLWIDPATGTILRVTIEADSKESASLQRAALLVQYAPVKIANETFVCPVHSLAYSKAVASAEDRMNDAPTEWLNETDFTNYHHFGSTSRIVPDSSTQP